MGDYWLKENAAAEPIGPYSGKLVRQFAAEERIGPDWLISPDQKKWQRAGLVKGLFASESDSASERAAAPTAKERPAIAALLMQSTEFPLQELQTRLEQDPWPDQGAINVQKGNLIFRVDGAIIAVAPMPVPYPARDLEGPCATSWMWPKGTSATSVKAHRSHVLLTVVGGELKPIPRRFLLTHLTATAAQQAGVMGVYWAEATLVHHPKIFIEMAQIMSPEAPPLHLWVDYRIQPNANKSVRLFTTGLDSLGMMEIEIPSIDMNPAQLREWAINITNYLIQKGPVLKHGDTIGVDAKHQMRITHAPSMFSRPHKNPVLRIENK